MHTEVEAVFWDIGGVVLDLDSVGEGHRIFVERLVDAHDITDRDAAVETWRAVLGSYFREREGTRYRPALDGYRKAVAAVVGEEIPDDAWMPAFERAGEEALRPVPGAREVLRRLDEAGVYLGVLSDIDTWEAERILGQFDVLGHFDHLTTSEEVGRTKPHRSMFETALEKSSVEPDRSLHIGDRYEHDMQGASRVGLRTVAFGGSAAGRADVSGDGPYVEADPAVDYVIDDLRELLGIVGIDTE